MRFAAAFALILSLPGCASPQRSNQIAASAADADAQIVWVAGKQDECQFASTGNGPWVDAITEIKQFDNKSRIVVTSNRETHWQCISMAIYALKQTGANIGFILNPASDEE